MRKSAKKAAFFFSTALLIMFFCSGCALAVAESAAEHAYDSISDGQSPREILTNTANGIGENLADYAGNLGITLGQAAHDISSRIGSALGSVFDPSAAAKQAENDEADLIDYGKEKIKEGAKEHIDTFKLNLDRYSELIINGRKQNEEISFPERDDLLGPFLCDYVFDGDTISLKEFPSMKFRLIGINTPESVSWEEEKNTEQGKYASDRTTELVEGREVYIEYDAQNTDKYGRQLVYVWLLDTADGLVMLQELLVTEGFAQTMEIQPNCKYADYFADLQHQAAEEGRGFWGDGYFN